MPRPVRKAPPIDADALRFLLRRQSGVVQVAQLTGAGVTNGDLQRMQRQRKLVRVAHNIYVDHTGDLTPLQQAWVAVLRCGPAGTAGLADESALAIAHRGDGSTIGSPIHVAVAAHHSLPPIPGIRVQRVSNLDDELQKHGRPPRLLPSYAALRAASRQTDPVAQIALLAGAVNRRSTRPRDLQRALAKLPRLVGRAQIAALVDDLAEGVCSVLEHAYLTKVERPHGLPKPDRQRRRSKSGRSEFRDLEYPGLGLVIELDGRAFHEGIDAWDNDHERDLDDIVDQKDTVRLGYGQVIRRGCATAATLNLVLRNHGWDGHATQCPACPTEGDAESWRPPEGPDLCD
jgi:hypothetical protein